MNMPPLPIRAQDIMVEWTTSKGGIGAVAYTNTKGEAYIGLYSVNQVGIPNGLPNWFKCDYLNSPMSIGSQDDPLDILVEVRVSYRGVSLVISAPQGTTIAYQQYFFAPWGSKRPRYGLTIVPTQMSKILTPFPEEVSA